MNPLHLIATLITAATLPLAQAQTTTPMQLQRAYEAAAGHTLDQQMHYEAERQRELLDKPEMKEGVAAFLEKRAPRFPAR